MCATQGRREVRGKQTDRQLVDGGPHTSLTPSLRKAGQLRVPCSLLLGELCSTSWQQPVISAYCMLGPSLTTGEDEQDPSSALGSRAPGRLTQPLPGGVHGVGPPRPCL